ncbi:MBL fold metallo-hydrolase [Ureibacillus acetophenoni]|uniref:Ribonuclease BN (tRNA processing enzyme) n=1 Tax=Ureibacillus acetophenoni TaxID=614649 RepID=A0A285US52_9BACL|nr:MBL fold metallo-hydrolase [Ureibacillus acetophenoni]SOC44652.1 ribonuclease BN (tRNA processing enzyme) [Ureibacillus acetophenoni]
MKITPLGVGGAFTKTNYHNNYIFQLGETLLLVDAGTTLRTSLAEAGYHYTDIDFVYISHLHFDHVGGLEEMILQRYWNFENGQHAPVKTKIIVHEKLLHSIRSILSHSLNNQGQAVEDFCQLITPKNEGSMFIGEYTFTVFDTTNAHQEGMISSGFKLSRKGKNLVYTSDIKRLEQANLLSQIDESTVAIFQDVSFTTNGAHATIEEVLSYYPSEIHEKIYAMHYNDNVGDFEEVIEQAKIQLAKRGKIIEFK